MTGSSVPHIGQSRCRVFCADVFRADLFRADVFRGDVFRGDVFCGDGDRRLFVPRRS